MATTTEHESIEQAALDYFEGWFDGDVARMDRALHRDLVKRSSNEDGALGVTTKGQMLQATAAGRGKRADDRQLNVTVEDVYGDIASVTVHSAVYHEYLQLVRTGDGWKIANALWRHT